MRNHHRHSSTTATTTMKSEPSGEVDKKYLSRRWWWKSVGGGDDDDVWSCMCNNPFPASAIMTTNNDYQQPIHVHNSRGLLSSFIVFAFGNASTTEASTSSSSTSKEEIELNLVPTGERRSQRESHLQGGRYGVAEVFMMNGEWNLILEEGCLYL